MARREGKERKGGAPGRDITQLHHRETEAKGEKYAEDFG